MARYIAPPALGHTHLSRPKTDGKRRNIADTNKAAGFARCEHRRPFSIGFAPMDLLARRDFANTGDVRFKPRHLSHQKKQPNDVFKSAATLARFPLLLAAVVCRYKPDS